MHNLYYMSYIYIYIHDCRGSVRFGNGSARKWFHRSSSVRCRRWFRFGSVRFQWNWRLGRLGSVQALVSVRFGSVRAFDAVQFGSVWFQAVCSGRFGAALRAWHLWGSVWQLYARALLLVVSCSRHPQGSWRVSQLSSMWLACCFFLHAC